MAFTGMTLTNQGQSLQAKVQGGATLNFTKIKVGDGALPQGVLLQNLTDLIHLQMTVTIQNLAVPGDSTCQIKGILSNTGLASGFFVREIGLYASDPTAGEILYAVSNAGDQCDYLPAAGSAVAIEHVLTLITVVGSAANVTATINNTIVYATKQDLLNHTSRTDNPHATTCVQIGAAPINSPALTGTPTAPTAALGTNTTQLANTSFVAAAIAALVNSAPGTLNTLNELATALGDDPNFATTITNLINSKAPGGYGLGTYAKDISNTNLNDCMITGHYRGSGLTNSPTANTSWFYVNVIANSATYACQEAVEFYTDGSGGGMYGKSYYRICQNGTWSAWKQVMTKDLTDAAYAPITTAMLPRGYNAITTKGRTWTVSELAALQPGFYTNDDATMSTSEFACPVANSYFNMIIFPRVESQARITAMVFFRNGVIYTYSRNTGLGTDNMAASEWKQVMTKDLADAAYAPNGYGLGNTVSKSSVDLNAYKSTGDYYFTINCTNAPDNYVCCHVSGNGIDATQICVSITTGKVYYRAINSSVGWTAWQQIMSKDLTDAAYAPGGYGLGTYTVPCPGNDANNAILSGFYVVTGASTGGLNIPTSTGSMVAYLFVESMDSNDVKQTLYDRNTKALYIRAEINGTWSPWLQIMTKDLTDAAYAPSGYGLGTTGKLISVDLNTISANGFYYCSGCTNRPVGVNGYLLTESYTAGTYQKQTYSLVDGTAIYVRYCYNATWSSWVKVMTKDLTDAAYAPSGYGLGSTCKDIKNTDLNTVATTGFYYSDTGCTNGPSVHNGYLLVEALNNTYITQMFTDDVTGLKYTRICGNGTWTAWQQLATTNITPQIAIMTGVIGHGGTIPLPTGYTSAQCVCMVWPHDFGTPAFDVNESGTWPGFTFKCQVDANRMVTALHAFNEQGAVACTAGYVLIGIKPVG